MGIRFFTLLTHSLLWLEFGEVV